jgi:hypothetical protein
MDELAASGRLEPTDYVLLSELIATCLAARAPDREIHPDIEAAEAKRAYNRERNRSVRERVVQQADNSCTTPHTPRVNKLNIKTPQTPHGLDASFEVFYQAYPKRRARGKAEQAYTKALLLAKPEELLAGAKRYSAEVRGKEEQFVAFPATWLNQKRWLDEPVKATQSNVVGFRKELPPESPRKPRTAEEQAEIDAKLAKLVKVKRV